MAEQDWTNGRYLRQRRNLNALSIVMLIYVLAGGSVKSGSSTQLPGGLMTIKLEHPEVVIALAWVSLLYFMWRYWLSSADLRRQIEEKRLASYRHTKYANRVVNKLASDYKIEDGKLHGVLRSKTGKWWLAFGSVISSTQQIHVPDHRLPFFPFVFIAWLAEIKAASASPEFSEFYTPFFLAWFAILSFFFNPLLF